MMTILGSILAQSGSSGRGLTSGAGGDYELVLIMGGLIVGAGLIAYVMALNKSARREELSEIPSGLTFSFKLTSDAYDEARDGANFKDIRQMPSGEVVRRPFAMMVRVMGSGEFRLPAHLIQHLTESELKRLHSGEHVSIKQDFGEQMAELHSARMGSAKARILKFWEGGLRKLSDQQRIDFEEQIGRIRSRR